MYRNEPYTGEDLPSKFLCLTYDDGPGKYTFEIARFLYDQNVQATFFVVGKYALHHQDILEQLTNMGHLIGNHTYEHPDMPYYLSINGDVHNQILRTDAIIKKYVAGDNIYFRSPYGKWSREVAQELNLNMLSAINHIGPIHWDIGGIDCYYWKNDRSVDYAVQNYIKDIQEKDKGIVVMHDEIADMNYLKDKNKTLELTKQLVPLLKGLGYKFVRLDEIESIKNAASETVKFSLQCSNAKFISLSEDVLHEITVDGRRSSGRNELSMVELGHGKIALKASNDLFFSVQEGENFKVKASGEQVTKNETFDLIPLSTRQIALRAYNGNYLTKENKNGGRLVANAPYMRRCEKFSFLPVNIKVTKKISLIDRYKSLRRKFLYIQSKIQQGV